MEQLLIVADPRFDRDPSHRDAKILILDDALSSVDTETEILIREALHTLIAGRSTMAVAHRLSTVQDMDRILEYQCQAEAEEYSGAFERDNRTWYPGLSQE